MIVNSVARIRSARDYVTCASADVEYFESGSIWETCKDNAESYVERHRVWTVKAANLELDLFVFGIPSCGGRGALRWRGLYRSVGHKVGRIPVFKEYLIRSLEGRQPSGRD